MSEQPFELFPEPKDDRRRLLDDLPDMVERVFPIPRQHRGRLHLDVAELSRLLTSGRGERQLSYLNRPAMLSAYLRYFLPWNVYRLSRLLPSLPLSPTQGLIIDLGSGPLTLPISLWIACPGLRNEALRFLCVDQSGNALEAGKKLFEALTGGSGSKWEIKTLRRAIHEVKPLPSTALICAVNVFNESAGKIPPFDREALKKAAEREARFLENLSSAETEILVMEPGTPQSAAFITELRSALLDLGSKTIAAPCPHDGDCPFPGGFTAAREKQKWCHFAFDTENAPQKLQRLSAAAKIPKERAALSFLYARPGTRSQAGASAKKTDPLLVRVLSDAFAVGSGFGRYGCSASGAVLLTGTGSRIDALPSGTLLPLAPPEQTRRDPKSGALMLNNV